MKRNAEILENNLNNVFCRMPNRLKSKLIIGLLGALMLFLPATSFAHCDSYDGPVIQDAYKALETNDVNLVIKWISREQEKEIISLFNKTYSLRNSDREIYQIVEKHFLETLVRLHRETEGASYTGLKPAGTIKAIVVLTDQAITTQNVDDLAKKLNGHIEKVIREKYHQAAALYNSRDESPEKGRAYVKAYVDYTHTLEAIHEVLEHGGSHQEHSH
jgi:hypothetical protein